MLAKDVRAVAEDPDASEDLRRLAAALAEQYRYPVDFQVVDTTGELYAQGEANHMVKPYREVLLEGLREVW